MDDVEFFRANQRPDVVVTGAFAPTRKNLDIWGSAWRAFMGVGDASDVPLLLPEGSQVHVLDVAAGCCRYCRAPRDRARWRCENCGAPYPAIRVA